jgi:hypothetical protein
MVGKKASLSYPSSVEKAENRITFYFPSPLERLERKLQKH